MDNYLESTLSAIPFLNADDLYRTYRIIHFLLFGQPPLPRPSVDVVVITINELAEKEHQAKVAWINARINGASPGLIQALELERLSLLQQRGFAQDVSTKPLGNCGYPH